MDGDGGSGRIFQDIAGLNDVFQTKGSPAGPQELRTEVGVLYSYDLEQILRRQLATQDALNAGAVSPGAGLTATSTAFSFSSDHVFRSIMLQQNAGISADFGGAIMLATPFGDPTTVCIATFDPADVVTVSGVPFYPPKIAMPLKGLRATDYQLQATAGAGGGISCRLALLMTLLPTGVGI